MAMRKKQAATIALICGIGVFLLKLVAFIISNSIALLSDALESIINILASGMMFFSILISERDPDQSHKYGHQKIEDISCLFEGVLIILAAVFIIITAVGRLSVTNYFLELNFGIIISVVATALNLGVSFILLNTAKKTGSIALEGDSKHLLSDVFSSVVVWVGLIIGQLIGLVYMDSLLAFVVVIFIIRMGVRLVLKASRNLMDQSCIDEEKAISDILKQHEYRFIDFHDLKTRRSGSLVFAELHLSVVSSLSVKKAHDLTDHLEADIKEACPKVNLTIHIEPS